MTKSEIINRMQAVCRTRHLSYNTELVYCSRARDFIDFVARNHRDSTNEERVRAWLEDMAPRVAAKTQAQALNAIVFMFGAIEKPLGDAARGLRSWRSESSAHSTAKAPAQWGGATASRPRTNTCACPRPQKQPKKALLGHLGLRSMSMIQYFSPEPETKTT